MPTLTWTGRRYEVHRAYEIREQLKTARFQFDPSTKTWFTENPKTAVRAIKLANPETKQMLLYLMTH